METIKKKRIREKPGQVFRVSLGNSMFGYGQLTKVDSIFFDYCDDGTVTDPAFVIQQPVVFEIAVVIKDGFWEVIAVLPVNSELTKSKPMFSYSRDTNSYFIWPGTTPSDRTRLYAHKNFGVAFVRRNLDTGTRN